ncbi:hypothetical protein KBB27_01880 [Patescibacteria group bacterium]|nr:hypothetical protein [Patescibacteria group bacterium]
MINQASPLAHRIIQPGVTAEEVRLERERLLQMFNLRPITTFHSAQVTGGLKDVVACETRDGTTVILRLGERRPNWFFTDGFVGKTLRIPRQFHAGGDRVPYEIEEHVTGPKICDVEHDWNKRGQISPVMQDRLIAVFWEFQSLASPLPLEQLFYIDRLQTFFHEAGDLVPPEAGELIKKYTSFWNGSFPAKWKFATDNLIVDENDKVVFIDNVKIGTRYFGYDLGWLIWPRWVEMDTSAFTDIDGQVRYLDTFKQKLVASIPPNIHLPQNIDQAFDLMLFERLIASLFDVQRQARHFTNSGMMGDAGLERRMAHTVFVQNLLTIVMKRLS